MKKILTTAIIITAIILSFLLGESKCKSEIIEVPETPSYEDYIHCDSFENFYLNGNELHFFAGGHEYIFEN